MKATPTFSTTLDPMSIRLQNNTSTIQLIPLVDDYNSYYPDPDYGIDPIWEANCYNQHHLYFYNKYNKPEQDVEPDSPEIEHVLNTILGNVQIDQ